MPLCVVGWVTRGTVRTSEEMMETSSSSVPLSSTGMPRLLFESACLWSLASCGCLVSHKFLSTTSHNLGRVLLAYLGTLGLSGELTELLGEDLLLRHVQILATEEDHAAFSD